MSKEMDNILKTLKVYSDEIDKIITKKSVLDYSTGLSKDEVTIDEGKMAGLTKFVDDRLAEFDKQAENKEDLEKMMASIKTLSDTLRKYGKEASVKSNKKYIDMVDKVKGVTENLTKRKEAIEKIKMDDKEIKIFKQEIENDLNDYDSSIDTCNKKIRSVNDFETQFSNEIDEYSDKNNKQKMVEELDKLIDSVLSANKNHDDVSNDSASTVQDKADALKKLTDAKKLFNDYKKQYESKYGKMDIPDTDLKMDDFSKNAKTKMTTIKKDVKSEFDNAKTNLENKFSAIDFDTNPKNIKILATLGLKKDDFTTGGVDKIMENYNNAKQKLLSDRSKLQHKRMLREESLNSIKGLKKADKLVENLENKSDAEIATGKKADQSVASLIEGKFNNANLPTSLDKIGNVKRKDLREVLRTTIYNGKRFARLRSFVQGTFKKSAYRKLRENYRNEAISEYAKAQRDAAIKNRDDIKDRQQSFMDRVHDVKVSDIIKGKSNTDKAIYTKVLEDDENAR